MLPIEFWISFVIMVWTIYITYLFSPDKMAAEL